MTYKSEEQILNIVKFIPPLFIILLSMIALIFVYIENKNTFIKEKNEIEKEYLLNNKVIIKNQVLTVSKFIQKKQLETEKKLKSSIKKRVYEAYDIAINIYNENKSKDKQIVTKMIKDALRTIRFNDERGYFFINDKNGKNVLHGLNESLENKSLLNIKTLKNRFIVQDTLAKLKNKNEFFDTWYWQKLKNSTKQYKKIGFIKKFEPYDWYIGTAEYLDEFDNSIKKDVLSEVNSLKYEKSGYIFIFNQEGIYLAHARKSSLGKNILDSKGTLNKKGEVNVDEVFNSFKLLAKSGGGYYSYIQRVKPTTKLPTSKIAYIAGIDNWNWIIGKGFYEDDVKIVLDKKKKNLDEKFKDNLKKIVIATLIIALLLLMVSLYFSKFLEEKFRNYKKEIKNYLEDNTRQQNILAQQAKMAAMGEMIGNIAHQWRQPLSTISTASTGLKLSKEMNILTDENLNNSLDMITKSVKHLSQTIDDFRDFFKPKKEKVDFLISEIIDKTINLISAQFINKEISLIQNIEIIKMNGFERELMQVLINILNNAKDALVDCEYEKYIFIDIYKNENEVIIKIKDNAGGINEKIIEKIFDPYFTTKDKRQGTGVGLYMSNEIITKHMEGEIIVENEKFNYKEKNYKGACFTISLPLTQ